MGLLEPPANEAPTLRELRLLNREITIELLEYLALTNVPLHSTKAELVIRRPEVDEIDIDFISFLAPF